MDFSVSILTRRGGRPKNEDRADHTQTEGCALFVLADGMGGHPDGEIAADIAVRTMVELLHKQARISTLPNPAEFLAKGLKTAHHRIIRYGTEQGLFDVPRTTAVACLVQDDKIWWGNCGDSRFYLYRGDRVIGSTVDHSVIKNVERVAKESNDSEDADKKASIDAKAKKAISRSALYTCLGSMALPVIDVTGPIPLIPGDRFILCSDGLWSVLAHEKIAAVLGTSTEVRIATTNLVESALLAAGSKSDNVTVIGVDWQPALAPDKLKNQPTSKEKLLDILDENALHGEEVDSAVNEINAILQRLEGK